MTDPRGTLADHLARWLDPHVIRHLCRWGCVTVEGQEVEPGRIVEVGDVVRVEKTEWTEGEEWRIE